MYLYFHFLVKISHGKDTYLWDRSGGSGFLCQEWMHTLMMGGGGWVPLSRVNAHLDDDDDDDDDDDVEDDDDDWKRYSLEDFSRDWSNNVK